ncbi:Nicotinamide N-methyltransferase-like protein [Gossypium australe]|uniref:Nicotinamide N-methyltransferase-like protein n=1 Tax=Gossypium australe TaxID=47621 RepID=A0A5B6VHL8_9ROSI|nr:Nicotinamide N-methyltransferase-like protein [Gossypium australe]
MAEQELDSMSLSELRLLSAFLAMETTDTLLCLARECGGGKVTEKVQSFIWDNCLTKAVGKGYESYSKKFVKKLITEIESNHGNVLDELYEQYASYMISFKDDNPVKENERVCKCISFLFPGSNRYYLSLADCFKLSICPKSRKLVVPLQCSLNMLEGDTGCSVWPSSLFLSEFILSYPHIFSGKSCFEVGSGVGLVGICLAHVKASKAVQSTSSVITDNEIESACFVILSDGDLSTLANMKLNLEKNRLNTETNLSETSIENQNVVSSSHGHFIPFHQVKCIHLPWESASEKELQNFMPEIILGADVIYDPSCLPHLVKLLAILLNKKKSYIDNREGSIPNSFPGDGKVNDTHDLDASSFTAQRINTSEVKGIINDAVDLVSRADPVAYIASVIRNADTFDRFLALADQADLRIKDLTYTLRPFDLLPYMKSYDRSSIRLFTVT